MGLAAVVADKRKNKKEAEEERRGWTRLNRGRSFCLQRLRRNPENKLLAHLVHLRTGNALGSFVIC